MRIKTLAAWIFVGSCLLVIGTLLYTFEITKDGKLASFLAVIGLVYFGIGVMLGRMYDQHMARRTRAGRE